MHRCSSACFRTASCSSSSRRKARLLNYSPEYRVLLGLEEERPRQPDLNMAEITIRKRPRTEAVVTQRKFFKKTARGKVIKGESPASH